MSGTPVGIHVTSLAGLVGFVLLWLLLFECAHVVVALLRDDSLIGWAIGPLGLTTIFLREPPLLYMLIEALFPAAVSGFVLYLGLFSSLTSPLFLPHHPLLEFLVIVGGVLITSTGDFVRIMYDLCYPLWGEARILRTIQFLRASWTSIHFTSFGLSYLRDHFDFTPTDLLQAF